MGFFSTKIKLNEIINEQENKITQLEKEKKTQLEVIKNLKEEITKYKKENSEYESRYVNTDLECEFCYTTLQKEFAYCPKCGKKIIRPKFNDTVNVNKNIFSTEEDGKYLLINQYNGFNDKKIVIPSHINGKPVIGIWNSVFEKCVNLEEVIFEEGCKYIGKSVFKGCSRLKKVRLPKSLLEIGDFAFSGCALEEIAIPPHVRVIGLFAFSSCESLTNVLLPENLKCISQNMLSNTAIEEITIPQSVVHINYGAFSDTKLKEIELPYNLYSIGENAFDIPYLSKITIHSNVEILSENIFGDCNKNIYGNYGNNILGNYNKRTGPTIYCAAGSKGLLYARKYGLDCKEIPAQPPVNVEIGSSGIILVLKTVEKNENLAAWYKYLGLTKAETWSWNVRYKRELYIEKYMDTEEALNLKECIQKFGNSHRDWLAPYGMSSLKELSVCKHWGESVV